MASGPAGRSKKKSISDLTMDQKLTLIHGRQDSRLDSLKEMNWKLGQFLDERTNRSPEMQRLVELKKIGTIMAIKDIDARRKRRDLERGKVPTHIPKSSIPKDPSGLHGLYTELSKKAIAYAEDLEPVAERLGDELQKQILSDAKNIWIESKSHAITLQELGSVTESPDLRGVNDEEKRLLAILMGKEEKPKKKEKKRQVRLPDPVEEPKLGTYNALIGIGAVLMGLFGFLFLNAMLLLIPSVILVLVGCFIAPFLSLVGLILLIVGLVFKSKKKKEYNEAVEAREAQIAKIKAEHGAA